MKRLIVAISGASGAILGVRLLEALKKAPEVETHLVVSRGAEPILLDECGLTREEVSALADFVYDENDLGAAISSGSFRTDGMIVLPCSMKTLSGVAHAYDENLIIRAADVCLKERRKLVLCPRETPLNRIHIQNMLACTDAGAIVMPPMMAFYAAPQSVEDMAAQFIGKVLLQFDLSCEGFRPWEGKA